MSDEIMVGTRVRTNVKDRGDAIVCALHGTVAMVRYCENGAYDVIPQERLTAVEVGPGVMVRKMHSDSKLEGWVIATYDESAWVRWPGLGRPATKAIAGLQVVG